MATSLPGGMLGLGIRVPRRTYCCFLPGGGPVEEVKPRPGKACRVGRSAKGGGTLCEEGVEVNGTSCFEVTALGKWCAMDGSMAELDWRVKESDVPRGWRGRLTCWG